MEFDWTCKIFYLFCCLFLLTLFSLAEIVFFSADKGKSINSLLNESWIPKYVKKFFSDFDLTHISLLLGSTIAIVGASIYSVEIAIFVADYFKISAKISILFQIIILTILILLIGKFLPVFLVNHFSEYIIKIVVFPVYLLNVVSFPLYKMLKIVSKLIKKYYVKATSITKLQDHNISEFANLRNEKVAIEKDEQELIEGIVTFKNTTAREVMTPRVDIQAIEINDSFDNLIEKINSSGHSRIPLYRDSLDQIIGIIYAKDLLPFIKNSTLRKSLSLKSIAKDVLYVPSSKMIKDLLHEFQTKKLHLGIVVDEYGGTAGLITLEDILEEIVGEIRDENEKEEEEFVKLAENKFIALGKLPIYKLNEFLEDNFSSPNDNYDTLGGFILNHAGKIPLQNYSFVKKNYKFTVKEVSKKRINKVVIEKEPNV